MEGHQIFPLRLDEPRSCRQSGALHLWGLPALAARHEFRRGGPGRAEPNASRRPPPTPRVTGLFGKRDVPRPSRGANATARARDKVDRQRLAGRQRPRRTRLGCAGVPPRGLGFAKGTDEKTRLRGQSLEQEDGRVGDRGAGDGHRRRDSRADVDDPGIDPPEAMYGAKRGVPAGALFVSTRSQELRDSSGWTRTNNPPVNSRLARGALRSVAHG